MNKFKVGDKVRILDSIKETRDWGNFDDLKDMSGVISKVCNDIEGLTYYINDVWIGAEYIVPDLKMKK